MTMLLHHADNNGLFDILGQAFHALDTLNTNRLTTVANEVIDVVEYTELITGSAGMPSVVNSIAAVAGVGASLTSWQSAGSNLTSGLKTAAQSLVTAYCQADNTSLTNNITDCLTYLVDQMAAGTVTGGDYVTAPSPTVTITTGASSTNNTAIKTSTFGTNAGTVCLAAVLARGDGQVQQNALAETITAVSQSDSYTPSILLTSPIAVTDKMSQAWPAGSGLNTAITAVGSANNLLTNGSFETTTIANQPDNWIIAVGVPGTTITATTENVQTVQISGTPTGGTYVLVWPDSNGEHRATRPLPYTATQSEVQSALRAIVGLEAVTVASVFVSGSAVNVTHTITFYDVGGAVTALEYISQLTGGSPTITIVGDVVASDANTLRGRALVWTGVASPETTTMYSVLPTLAVDTTYILGFHARIKSGDTVTGGELTVDIVDGIGGSVVDDSAGTANTLAIDHAVLSSSAWTFFALGFRIPPAIIQPVYLRVRLTTAITSATSIYLDEFAIARGTEIYPGGPIVAAFAGSKPARIGDVWAITVANTMSGKFQKDFNRFFNMAELGLLLPTASGGGALIDDALVA